MDKQYLNFNQYLIIKESLSKYTKIDNRIEILPNFYKIDDAGVFVYRDIFSFEVDDSSLGVYMVANGFGREQLYVDLNIGEYNIINLDFKSKYDMESLTNDLQSS